MRKIRVAHLGIAHDHSAVTMECARKYPDIFEVVGVCEPNEATRAQFGSEPAYKDIPWLTEEELFSIKDLDAVLCEGHELRSVSDAQKCIDHGLHVHLDKPGGTSLPAFEHLLRSADEKGLTVQMGYMYRWNPAFRYVYNAVKEGLEKIAGHEIKSEDIAAAIKVYNKSRAARRAFVKLASEHCDVIDPIMRSAVLKAAWFMDKAEYTEKLEALNAELAALPAAKWNGVKVVTSGIICDNPALLKVFKDNNVAIAADDVAHESRAFRTDASEEGDPMMALVEQFTNTDYDVLLYDPQSSKNRRGEFVANMVKESGAQGLVLFMQQFCDPEEMEFPYLKKALDAAGIPFIKLGVDQQMRDFGQAATAIQAFADVLALQ